MEVYKSLKDFSPLANSVITIGSYDGLHRGHFQIINRVQTIAESINTDSVVITFDPHPRHVIKGGDKNIKLIMGMQKKTEIIRTLKIDKLIILDFSDSFRKISADDFMSDIIIKYFNPKYIVAGFNHTFGYNRKGDSNFLSDYCQRKEIGLEIVKPLKDSDVIISSTNIRKLIINGFIRRANFELGSLFGFSTKVVHGSGRGKGLEFPTANLVPLEKRQLLPKKGVYFTRCIINGLNHYGMCNFGIRPTFGENDLVLEVHLFDETSQDLYDSCIWIEFLERIRDEKKFPSAKELIKQLKKDEEICLSLKYKYQLGE